jgi:hypothetical protein
MVIDGQRSRGWFASVDLPGGYGDAFWISFSSLSVRLCSAKTTRVLPDWGLWDRVAEGAISRMR